MIQASVITIGDEILIGQIVDTNSSKIASALELAGVKVARMLSVADKREEIEKTLRTELSEHDIVITTGGLGPTKDDITKAVLKDLCVLTWKRSKGALLGLFYKDTNPVHGGPTLMS